MNRLAWVAALPVLLVLGWAGRATPQIDDYVRGKEWFNTAATGPTAEYAGLTWRPGPALVSTRVPADATVPLPPGQKAVLIEMQVTGIAPKPQIADCRLTLVDAAGKSWTPMVFQSGAMIEAVSRDGEDAGGCDRFGFSAPPGKPLKIDTVFLVDRAAPEPYTLRLSSRSKRPSFVTLPLVTAPGK